MTLKAKVLGSRFSVLGSRFSVLCINGLRVIPLGLVVAATACDPPVVTVEHIDNVQLDLNKVPGAANQAEGQIVVLPKGTPACSGGAVVYSSGAGAGRIASSVNATINGADPLSCPGSSPCFDSGVGSNNIFLPSYKVGVDSVPLNGICNPTNFSVYLGQFQFATDNTVTRIDAHGTLLATNLGKEYRSPAISPCNEPVPLRSVIGLSVSTDCGANWVPVGVPPIVATNPDRPKGFDRQVVYASPWGPDSSRNDLLIALMDIPLQGDRTRSIFHAYSDDLMNWTGPVTLTSLVPKTPSSITSTPPTLHHSRGAVVVVTCGTLLSATGGALPGNRAIVHLSRDGGISFGAAMDITRLDSNGNLIECKGIEPDHLAGKTPPGIDDLGNPTGPEDAGMKNFYYPAVSRVLSSDTQDVVRVAYPTVRKSSEGHDIQTYVMQIVRFDAKDRQSVVAAGGLNEDPYSVIFLDFTQTDRWDTGDLDEADPASNRTVAMYYRSSHIQSGSQGLFRNDMTARYYAIEGVTNDGTSGDLATRLVGTTPSRVSWTPIGNPTGDKSSIWYGDYQYNAFYATTNAQGSVDFNYLLMWPQPLAGVENANAVYYFNHLKTTP